MTEEEKKTEIKHKAQLIAYFERGNTPTEKWGIGTENEKFLFSSIDNKRLHFNQGNGISDILVQLQKDGWTPIKEGEKTIGLRKNGASITLEPGGQFELSGENITTIHETFQETRKHFQELNKICLKYGFYSLPMGVDPLSNLSEIPWVPKERYRYMKDYMPTKGELGLEMMTKTASIQVNLDYCSENDMVKKMRVAQALQPIVTAIFANSPFSNGKPNGYLSYRAHIWDNTDPDRCGFLPFIFDEAFGFERWTDYLLDIPMYFIFRDGRHSPAKGLTFRDFINGKHNLNPTMADWELHASTVFPDVRLKNFIEMRGADANGASHIAALSALWVGLLYDRQSLEEVHDLISEWNIETIQEVRSQVPVKGLNAESGNLHAGHISRKIYQISKDGLVRRSQLRSTDNQSRFLEPVNEITKSGITIAEKLLQRYKKNTERLPELLYQWQKEQMEECAKI